MAQRRSRVVTVSLPPELADEFERIADEEQRTRSELFREMLRTYRIQREIEEFRALQRYGAGRDADLGVLDEARITALRVPAAAVGEEVTVELVEWAPPMSLGVVSPPIPTSVQAGVDPSSRIPVWVLPVSVVLALLLLRSATPAWPALRVQHTTRSSPLLP